MTESKVLITDKVTWYSIITVLLCLCYCKCWPQIKARFKLILNFLLRLAVSQIQ